MQKYILCICIILCTNFLSAQLKEKVASFAGSLQNLKKFISQSGDLLAIDVTVKGTALLYIFRGMIDEPAKLKDFLVQYYPQITIAQAQKLYTEWEAMIDTAALNKILPEAISEKILKGVATGSIKSAEDLETLMSDQGYSMTSERAEKLYRRFSIPTDILPPPLKPITPQEAFSLIEKNLKLKSGSTIDYQTVTGITQYLQSQAYIVTPELAADVLKLFKTRQIEEAAKVTTKPKTPIKPLGEKAAQEQSEAIAAVKKAIDVDKKVFGDVGAIIRYLKSITKYPTDFTTNLPEAKFREKLKDFVPKKD